MTLLRSLLRTLAFTGLYVVAAYAGRLTVMDGTNLSLVWPAAGVSAVWFLVQHTSRHRWADVVALSAATIVVNVVTGASVLLAAFFVVANLLQVFVFGYLFRRWLGHLWGGGGDRPLAKLHELWGLVAAAFVSTAAGALIGPTGVWVVNGSYSWPATAVWMTRNTVSILLIGAACLRLGHAVHHLAERRRCNLAARPWSSWVAMPPSRKGEYLAVALLSAAGYYAVFGVNHGLPLAFTVLVMTVWAGLRLDTGFVIVHDVTFGCVAILFTLHHRGVFASIASHSARALVAQLFVGIIAVVGLALALGRDERTALIKDLTAEREAAAGQATLMSAIIDAMTEGLTVVDEQGRILLRNPASRHLLGGAVSTSDRPAQPGYYGLFHPDGTALTADEMPHRRALTGDDVHDMDIVIRNAGVPDGRILSVSSTLLPNADGTPCAVTVFHDVTAERRHRDELGAFAGVVAHDLLNPLAAIDGWARLLADTFDDKPDDPVAVQGSDGLLRIKRAAGRMRHLINDLLAYTTARDATITATDVDLGGIVADIAAARIDQAKCNRTLVPLFRLADLHRVYADPVLVRQLLDNLISNAIKYVGMGVTPQITIGTERVDGLVTVTVTDNGIGVPAGEHRNIFDNFHRAHRTAGYTGTGLGLGICKRIVELHGSTITATENPDGPGSRFTFTLPADATVAAAVPTAQQQRRVDTPTEETPEPDTEPHLAPEPVIAQDPGELASLMAGGRSTAPTPGAGFEQAARLVLNYLHDELPLAFWAITRVENGQQTFLYLDADNTYGLRQGDSHPWQDSFCVHMAAGRAPTVAIDIQAVPAYAQANVNIAMDIGAYAGTTIVEPDGTLFGAICGLDPQVQSTDSRMAGAESLLALLGHLLNTALAADRAQDRTEHALLREQLNAETDTLTGLPNRRAWQRLVAEARSRHERLADPTAVAIIDLDNLKIVNETRGHAAGDAYIAAAAVAVRAAVRDTDIIARLGGDEFGLLLPNCTVKAAEIVIERIYTALEAGGVTGSIGWAPITVQDGFTAALVQADTAMYATKQLHRQKT